MQDLRASAAALAILWSGQALAADCGAIRTDAVAAARSADIPKMKSLRESVTACDPELGDWLGRGLGLALFREISRSNPLNEGKLMESVEYGRTWQALDALGDIARDRKSYTLAARRYQEALVELGDLKRTPGQPDPNLIAALRRKAETAGLLAPTYVPLTRGRDNKNAGLGALTLRGIKTTAVALPVQFKFGTSELTDDGKRAVEDMVAMLANEDPSAARLTVIGHTDKVGDEAYNLTLSRQRAQAVKSYLVAEGITATITVVGKGETDPFEADDPGRYTEAELDQMSRRVELVHP